MELTGLVQGISVGEVIQFTPLDEAKEAAVRELDRYLIQLWKDYGVKESLLEEEIQTWYWKTIVVGHGRQARETQIIAWKGIGISITRHPEEKKQKILNAESISVVNELLQKTKDSAFHHALGLWAREKIPGLLSTHTLAKKASQAESLANYLESIGSEYNAATQRYRARLLRRKAAGADVELPKRGGIVEQTRKIYSDLEKEGFKTRQELIAAAIAAGIHPGTAAVQYAQLRREQKRAAEAAAALRNAQQKVRPAVQQRYKPPWEV